MDYFSILNLKKEPFSNSPDPEYFFQSQQHLGCLQKLELSIRLKRGLNVVTGDVGTGKTTLCRQLIRRFDAEQNSETHLLLDPYFTAPQEFLRTIAGMFDASRDLAAADEWQIKEQIKQTLFRKGVDENRTIVLIIDEGQKIPEFCLEILREFLNFETNEFKLLQIVIFAQREFEQTLSAHANLTDRINLYHLLEPLNFKDTRRMINFRVDQSCDPLHKKSFFSYPALWAIYRMTSGYPRKIVNLCHKIMLAMIIQNRTRADYFLVRACGRRASSPPVLRWRRITLAVLAVMVTASIAIGLAPERVMTLVNWRVVPEPVDRITAANRPVRVAVSVKPPAPTASAARKMPVDSGPPAAPPEKRVASATDVSAEPAATIQPAKVTAPSQMPPAPIAVNAPPPTLGQVALQRNETLWRLIVKVYGTYDQTYLDRLKQANPGLEEPKRIVAGRLISIPAIPLTIEPAKGSHWLKLWDSATLSDAMQLLRTYPAKAPPIRIVPYWDGRKLSFPIVLRELFTDEKSAIERASLLPAEIGGPATVLSSWGTGAVFYANPNLKQKG